ncbi:tripartite tricarboxylate transporter substrate binding protein [Bradyrhizobium sp. AS23.2]|uniref:Bug family tripartite tricarboxylate transporter substrate binding protein n=1 Tax=Bradyrhizobium sp. AS23.2 TaxID=1680155 RepID=UPI00093E3360|nr:tripartite tricarboxylate transporter substrate binding protein [Bradyrhizobium sp. AS23.2]OKO83018.1 ABC transporter substrate-binding protein [Bradyrhizobium sp. AS23.2]
MRLLGAWSRRGILAAALLAGQCLIATAQEAYPTRSIRLLVGFAAGGATDVTFRKLGELASKQLGQPIIIENKPGAGATLAPSTMAKTEKPDGYTIAVATAGLLRYPYMQKVDWDPIKDFTWIAGLGGYSFALAVNADSPLKNIGDLIAYAKENPGKLTIATAGAGTTMHLLAEALAGMAEIEITHVGYRGSSEAGTAVLGGHTMATVDAVGTILPNIESGRMRVLLSFDAQPTDWLRGVPTAKSLGYDLVYPAPYGLVGPKDMPAPIVDKLYQAFKAAAESDEYHKLLETLKQTEWHRAPREYEQWAKEFYVSERSLVDRAKLLRQP